MSETVKVIVSVPVGAPSVGGLAPGAMVKLVSARARPVGEPNCVIVTTADPQASLPVQVTTTCPRVVPLLVRAPAPPSFVTLPSPGAIRNTVSPLAAEAMVPRFGTPASTDWMEIVWADAGVADAAASAAASHRARPAAWRRGRDDAGSVMMLPARGRLPPRYPARHRRRRRA